MITKQSLAQQKKDYQTIIEVLDFLQELGKQAEKDGDNMKCISISKIVDKLTEEG